MAPPALAGFRAWQAAERGRFVLFLPVCMAGGVAAYFGRGSEPGLWAPAVAMAVALLAAVMARGVARGVLLAAGFAALGFADARLATWRAPAWEALPRRAAIVAGIVAQVEALPEGRRVMVAAPSLDGGAARVRTVRLRLRDDDAVALAPGDGVRVRALLRPPAAPAYPGGWDTQRDAFFAGIDGYGFAIGPATRVSAATGGAWQALRETIAARVMAALPGARGAIAATLLTGLGAAIPPADRAAFQVSGLAHLLAVAGLHIGIVMGLVFGATRLLLTLSEYATLHWPVKRIAAVASLAGGALYLALTGAHVPILRSFAMATLVTLAVLTGRRAVSARGLALAALVLMVAAPEMVTQVSFQMSFAALLALVAGWEWVGPRLVLLGAGRWWRLPLRYVGGLAVTSALAGTAALPYAAYHFGNATLFYVPANMVAVPLTALWVMPWGLASLALMPAGLERLALVPAGWGVDGLLWLAHRVAAWPDAVWPVPRAPAAGLLAVSVGLAWLCLWRSRVRLLGVAAIAVGVASPWLVAAPDLLASDGGRVIAARVDGRIFMQVGRGADRFTQAAPQRVWGALPYAALPADGEAAAGAIACRAGVCRVRFAAGSAIIAVGDVAAADCAGVTVLVSDGRAGGGCGGALVVDRATLAGAGATEIRLTPEGPIKFSVTAERGARPWVIEAGGRPTYSPLPPAVTE